MDVNYARHKYLNTDTLSTILFTSKLYFQYIVFYLLDTNF